MALASFLQGRRTRQAAACSVMVSVLFEFALDPLSDRAFQEKIIQTIWFDYRGHNNSETPRDLRSLTVETLARDLGIILDELGIKEPVPLLGHSMGVNTVLEFYRQQPDRVSQSNPCERNSAQTARNSLPK